MTDTAEQGRKTRPPLCPCPQSCTPLFNGMAFDDRIKVGDLDEGYSGDCIGRAQPTEYVVGGQVHRNDMNHCIFTPLKGITRYQINQDDLGCMLHMCLAVLHELGPEKKCEVCGDGHRHTHWIVSNGRQMCCRCYYAQPVHPPQVAP